MFKYALIDCNNFFVSCERVFNPGLQKNPVVILSNNDGCVIARSNEAKRLGIPMGAPFYQYKNLIKQNKVYVLSSNYSLYADMSKRIMESLKLLASDIEVYSIDEAFIYFNLPNDNHQSYCKEIQHKLKQWTGVPVSIGIAPTKTLAKAANYFSKQLDGNGLFDLSEKTKQDHCLKKLDIEKLWGISKFLGRRLRHLNIHDALTLRDADISQIRAHFGVVMQRMVLELRGKPCLDLKKTKPQKAIISSRSFSQPLSNFDEIREALANYTAAACEKMRRQGLSTKNLSVFLGTNPFRKNQDQHHDSFSTTLANPTTDTSEILQAARLCLKEIYREGFHYHKAGIILSNLTQEHQQQGHLFLEEAAVRDETRMNTVDHINQTLGKNAIFYAAQGTQHTYRSSSEFHSPCYTTQWDELMKVGQTCT